MIKVLIVTTISGFLPQFELNDVKLLQQMGCEVHYASNFAHPVYRCNEQELEEMGIKLHRICVEKSPFAMIKNGAAIKQLRQIIDTEGISLVHCHNPMGGVSARVAAGMSKKKPFVLYTAHGLHFYKGAPLKNKLLYYPAERALARLTDGIITINREDYESAGRLPLRRKGAVYRIHGVGVNGERFRPRTALRQTKREELGIPEDAIHIVTAAELNGNKNQAVVIRALAQLADQKIYYSMCGKGGEEERLRKLIRRYGLEENIRLLGYREDMEEVLQSADVFAFPSKREGLGVAAIEALLCGVPLIAADNRGTREYAVDGKNALVCRADHPEEFADAIRKMTDADFRNKLAERCRTSAMPFTICSVEEKMRKIYTDVLKQIRDDTYRSE